MVILCHLKVRVIHPRVIHKNTGNIICNILGGRIIIVLMAMVDMVLVLGTSPFTPRKVILEDTGIMEGFRHLREIT